MDARIEQTWSRRWWRMPGESVLSKSIDGKETTVVFHWSNPGEWGLRLMIDGGRPQDAIFNIDAEDIIDLDEAPKAVIAALVDQLKSRRAGIQDPQKLASDPVLTAIAEALPKDEWTTGRRLRRKTGLDVDAFDRHLRRLIPRYVRRDAVGEDDNYSLTLPGLLVMDAALHSITIMESVYQAIARCYERNEDTEVFENADIVACGVSDSEVPLARTIARICLLVGGGATLNERVLRVPGDREMIAAQVKKRVRFLDYLHHAATEKQRNAHFAVDRPWLQSPLWVERDGSQPDYLPSGFLVPAMPSSSARRAVVETALNDDLSLPLPQPEDNEPPEHRLPRLDVTYGKKLGNGAFGTVWEATDTLLERKLAVKFLTSTVEFLDEDALLRQARSLARVAHPNLVVVYGAAWLRHPITRLVEPAIMMELLEGEAFLQWSAVQHDRESVLHVATGLLNGIAAMHAAGLHHGDLHAQNVIALSNGQAKIIDWRYQDTFLARSTASRNELITADERHAVDLVVSLFEKQGLRDESLELRRVSGIAAAQALIERMVKTAPGQAAPTPEIETAAIEFPPPPVQLDRTNVNENEKSEDQSELAIWPVQESDLDASEMMAEIDSLLRGGMDAGLIKIMFRNPPIKTAGARRWPLTHRPYGNVIQKWELDIRDRGFLAFRWAKFATHEHLLYETRELLDAIVVPVHLYELATTAATMALKGGQVTRISLRLTIAGSSTLLLQDDAHVTTKTMHSPKAGASLQARLEAQLPAEPGAIAARLINRVLSNFQVEVDRFVDPRGTPPIVRLDPDAYDKYLYSVGVKKATG